MHTIVWLPAATYCIHSFISTNFNHPCIANMFILVHHLNPVGLCVRWTFPLNPRTGSDNLTPLSNVTFFYSFVVDWQSASPKINSVSPPRKIMWTSQRFSNFAPPPHTHKSSTWTSAFSNWMDLHFLSSDITGGTPDILKIFSSFFLIGKCRICVICC